jgi:flagellar export protein FliJ
VAKFAFRLDPVLDHRQRLEDEQQLAFAAALSVQTQAEAVRDEYIARRAAMREKLQTEHGTMDSIDLRASYAHCDYLDRSIVAQQRAIDAARVEVDKERAKLVLKVQDKKVLEVLKERRRETFEFEAASLEQAEADEINSRHYQRVTTNSGENPS